VACNNAGNSWNVDLTGDYELIPGKRLIALNLSGCFLMPVATIGARWKKMEAEIS